MGWNADCILDKPLFADNRIDICRAGSKIWWVSDSQITAIKELPCLFSYEANHEMASRVGWITCLQTRPLEIRIKYAFEEGYPPIDFQDLERLNWDLEINPAEWWRTHWSIKGKNLWEILVQIGYPSKPFQSTSKSNPQILMHQNIPLSFIHHACGILAASSGGLSGVKIVDYCNAWAVDCSVDPPHSSYPFDAPNKRTALQENLLVFPPDVQYRMLLDLCHKTGLPIREEVRKLRETLIDRFGETFGEDLNASVSEERASVVQIPKIDNPIAEASPLRLFLCHASEDKPLVRDFYKKLKHCGYSPWLDEEDLLAGQDWRFEITRAVKTVDVIIVCLTKHATLKSGFVQREIKMALDIAEEKPEGKIFMIPVRFEECQIPERLSKWHYVNMYAPDGFDRLLQALKFKIGQ